MIRLSPFSHNANKGVTAYLKGIQFLYKDEALGGAPVSADAFDEDDSGQTAPVSQDEYDPYLDD